MLPKINRLRSEKEIEWLFKKGKGFKEKSLILKTVKSSLKNPRIIFIISRKVSKKATLRNKIRRRVNELLKLKIAKIKEGNDLALIALPGLEEKDVREIDETINKLFERAKCFK